MGQILKIALVPATLLWGAFSYNYYKCDIKGFCEKESVAITDQKSKDKAGKSKLPKGSPSDKIKDPSAKKDKIAQAYNQGTNYQEETWAQENITAFETKANQ